MLFTGTVRKNLDPFEAYIDTQLWKALDQVRHATLRVVVVGVKNDQTFNFSSLPLQRGCNKTKEVGNIELKVYMIVILT